MSTESATQAPAERVIALVAGIVGLRASEVRADSRLAADLDCDVIDMVTIAIEIEGAFHVEMSDDQAQACETVADLIALVEATPAVVS